MKVVLDTNVLVSGLLSPFGPPGEIVRMLSAGALTLCLDARVLSEYAEVLARPRFAFDQDMVASLLEYIAHVGQTVAAAPLPAALPDPDDQPFLELALSGGAEYLITGNRRHYPKALCGGVRVVTPAQFVAAYRANMPQ
ncbi:MAG: putative toxin-antitoxin system toxin component, PIN family [Ignavibacteria bacterium]|nr:putative toxin-antitoxin system toxin component, PIN family [Ignavibacteria bacterium]